jgi:3-phenylpropionate/trans-cinnamate dioxygenase ferredoxin subunit
MEYKKVTEVGTVPPGSMQGFEVGGKYLLVSNIGGKFYVIDGKCSHAGGDLAKGKLEGNTVTCPRHGAKFDVTSGNCLAGPKIGPLKINARNLAAYKVKTEGNDLMVEI